MALDMMDLKVIIPLFSSQAPLVLNVEQRKWCLRILDGATSLFKWQTSQPKDDKG